MALRQQAFDAGQVAAEGASCRSQAVAQMEPRFSRAFVSEMTSSKASSSAAASAYCRASDRLARRLSWRRVSACTWLERPVAAAYRLRKVRCFSSTVLP